MNYTLNFAHLCDYASLSEGDKLNILGIFKNISCEKDAAGSLLHPQMYVVTNISFEGKNKKYKEKIRIVNKATSNTINKELEFEVETTETISEIGVIAQFNNIKFPNAGEYKIEIFVDDTLIKEIPLKIHSV